MKPDFIHPEWPAPLNVHALSTRRDGGYSKGPWKSMNLGPDCGDEMNAVARNRARLRNYLPADPQWLRQVHGIKVLPHPGTVSEPLEGDALVAHSPAQVCAVLTADCLPVVFCNRSGNRVAVAHAGWRGLAGGILQATARAFEDKPENLIAWLGPAIGPLRYEVGDDVRMAFGQLFTGCFARQGDRWLLDLYAAARQALIQVGIRSISGGGFCTYLESEKFFSYRRDGVSGRMATLIWRD
jgi:YfiH family protein